MTAPAPVALPTLSRREMAALADIAAHQRVRLQSGRQRPYCVRQASMQKLADHGLVERMLNLTRSNRFKPHWAITALGRQRAAEVAEQPA